MKKIKFALVALLSVCAMQVSATDYKASLFGCKSDGTTMNTRSIQRAVEYISKHGGGRLVFYVGRYQTGTISLESNVTIHLEEGAILVASQQPYDYKVTSQGASALILAEGVENVAITGKGVIEGRAAAIVENTDQQISAGHIATKNLPSLVYMTNVTNANLDGVTLNDAAANAMVFDGCKEVTVNNVTTMSSVVPASTGVKLLNSESVTLTKNVFNTSGTPIVVQGGKTITATDCMDLVKGKKIQLKK